MAGYFVQGDYFVLRKPGKPPRWPAVILEAALLAALVFVPAIAHAAKRGNGGSSISLVHPYPATSAAAPTSGPHYTETVGFQVNTGHWDALGTGPWVRASCLQNGNMVYEQWQGYFDPSYTPVFTLGPTNGWTGGDADCTAELGHWNKDFGRFSVEGSTSFLVIG
jgi:hypothetical protein